MNFRSGSIPSDVKWREEEGVYFVRGDDSMNERSFWSAISGLIHVLTNPSFYPTVISIVISFIIDTFTLFLST